MPDPIPSLKRSWVSIGSPGKPAHSEKNSTGGSATLHSIAYSQSSNSRNVIVAQASADLVCVLDGQHDFSQALPFWEAFSGSKDTHSSIRCVSVGDARPGQTLDPISGNGKERFSQPSLLAPTSSPYSSTLIAASMDHRLAVWSSSSSSTKKWKVHSTLTVNDGVITSVHLHQGKLLLGTTESLSLWQLEESGITIWRRVWTAACPCPIRIARFSPEALSFAAVTESGRNVLIWAMDRKDPNQPRLLQRLIHSRQISDFDWRSPPDPLSQSDVLISRTVDGVVWIWAPVIDEPTKLRLWSVVDSANSLGDLGGRTEEEQAEGKSSSHQVATKKRKTFYLSAQVMSRAMRSSIAALEKELQMAELGVGEEQLAKKRDELELELDRKRTRSRRLEQLVNETPDMFMSLLPDNTLLVTAVASIDRRPPTLLENLTVLRVPIEFPVDPKEIEQIRLLPMNTKPNASSVEPTCILHLEVGSSRAGLAIGLNPALFFDGNGSGLTPRGLLPTNSGSLVKGKPSTSSASAVRPQMVAAHSRSIRRLARSRDGRTVASLAGDEMIVWRCHKIQKTTSRWERFLAPIRCSREDKGTMQELSFVEDDLDRVEICDGEAFFVHSSDRKGNKSERKVALTRSQPASLANDPVSVICSLMLMGDRSLVFGCTSKAQVSCWLVWRGDEASQGPSLLDTCKLEISMEEEGVGLEVPELAISVKQDATLGSLEDGLFITVTGQGILERWSPRIQFGKHADDDGQGHVRIKGWKKVGQIRIEKGKVDLLSSHRSGMVALVKHGVEGGVVSSKLSIWDLRGSAFTSGLEHHQVFKGEDILCISWSLSDGESILAIGFKERVELLCPNRLEIPHDKASSRADQDRWGVLARVEMIGLTINPIQDLTWMRGDLLLIASACQIYLYGPTVEEEKVKRNDSIMQEEVEEKFVAEILAQRTGPLPDYHPHMLQQCLVWGKIDTAKSIIKRLKRALLESSMRIEGGWYYHPVPLEEFYLERRTSGSDDESARSSLHHRATTTFQRSIFDDNKVLIDSYDQDNDFSEGGVSELMEKLDKARVPDLSESEKDHLKVMVRTTFEVDEQRRSLDENGLRYLVALRSFLIGEKDRRGEGTSRSETAEGLGLLSGGLSQIESGLERIKKVGLGLDYRDFVWAFHSESQELLLKTIDSAYGSKVDWDVARSTGIFFWVRSHQTLRNQAETVARCEYMRGEERDPVSCSLIYFALGKSRVVQGLWKQAVWHPDQKKMLQFLSHDFQEERWKTAALKNAFALLSQRRYLFAASFFMLGGSLKDAVNVCARNLEDLALAIAIARINEGSDDGPVLRELLTNRVLPHAFSQGLRWLASWSFWMLKRRDLAVRIILTPLEEMLKDPEIKAEGLIRTQDVEGSCGDGQYDDASLALLFSQLKTKSLQTIKGTQLITERKEFEFVLHMNKVLGRMGCQVLGLALLRNWRFDEAVVDGPKTGSQLQRQLPSQEGLAEKGEDQMALVLQSLGEMRIITEEPDAVLGLFGGEGEQRRRSLSRRNETSNAQQGQVDKRGSMEEEVSRRPDAPSSTVAAAADPPFVSPPTSSQIVSSPPKSPRTIRRTSGLMRRRSSILNDLDIHPNVSSNTNWNRVVGIDPHPNHGPHSTASERRTVEDLNQNGNQHHGEASNLNTSQPNPVEVQGNGNLEGGRVNPPPSEPADGKAKEEEEKPKGVARLFQPPKQNTQAQGAMEFDLSSFGF
ncbi:hypothetical protein IE53DRAFT_379141 [Violaceomyces palustris]|uniref:Uncharacterized protein n=1 Tax=Violaceomyces palustris TaxID=1673888 RepID=A0ACD0NZA2_9BASI|nr:hypothetical protein IE53DRAFT_379141 [Violaceomyces palustris]